MFKKALFTLKIWKAFQVLLLGAFEVCCWTGTRSGEPEGFVKACYCLQDWDPAVSPVMCSSCPEVSTKCSEAKVMAVA